VERPRIYGSEKNFRAALRRYVASGEELLAQAEGTRKRIAVILEERGGDITWKYEIEALWVRDLRRWSVNAARTLGRYLQDQTEPLPTIAWGLPPDTGKPRHYVGVDNGGGGSPKRSRRCARSKRSWACSEEWPRLPLA